MGSKKVSGGIAADKIDVLVEDKVAEEGSLAIADNNILS